MVVILGMHRSGTSCLAGCLQENGLDLGKVMVVSKFNPKGNRENRDVININDSILNFSKGSWDNPPDEVVWNETHIRNRDTFLRSNFQTNISGFKDPRTILTFDFWNPAIPNPVYIATFRHPLGVALSLKRRNQFDLNKGLLLWYAYNKKLLSIIEYNIVYLINFDDEPGQYLNSINVISEKLGLNGSNTLPDFYDSSHINIKSDSYPDTADIPDSILSLYDKLISISLNQLKGSFNNT